MSRSPGITGEAEGRGDGKRTCGAGDHGDDVRALRRRGEETLAAVPGVEAVEVTLSLRARWSPATPRDDRGDALEGDRGGGIPSTPAPDNRRESCSSGRNDGRWESTPSTHRPELFAAINSLLREEGMPPADLAKVLDYLEEYVTNHFGLEELYMRRLSYPGFPSHKGSTWRSSTTSTTCGRVRRQRRHPRTGRQDGPLYGDWLVNHIGRSTRPWGIPAGEDEEVIRYPRSSMAATRRPLPVPAPPSGGSPWTAPGSSRPFSRKGSLRRRRRRLQVSGSTTSSSGRPRR